MTRDEFTDLVGIEYADEYEKAQLSREDATSDTISRQAAIDALAEQMPTSYTPDGSHPADEGIFAAQEIYADCIETLELLPSAQPEERTKTHAETHACDLISRQAAIDAVNNAFDRETLLTGFVRSIAVRAIRDMQPAQPEQIWIMCSERLPEERDWYLGIFKEPDTGWINPTPFICDYLLGTKTKATTKEGWILKGHTDREEYIDYYFNLECVAWMPLPEPYKEGETT